MPQNDPSQPPQAPVQGPPAYVSDRVTSTSTQTLVPAPVPGFFTKDHMEAIGTTLATLGAFFVYCERKWETKRRREAEALNARLKPIEERIETFKPKEELASDKAALEKDISRTRHDINEDVTKALSRVHFLEQGRASDITRIVALETNMANIKEGQQRIERAVEKVDDAVAKIANSLADRRDS